MYEVAVTIIAVCLLLSNVLLFVKAGFWEKLLVKYGKRNPRTETNWTALSWESCLNKMNYRADIVFFGDSLVRGGDFHLLFPDKKVINLGSSGDTLAGMCRRVSTVKMLEPKQIFFLGGINGLSDHNVHICLNTYKRLIEALQEALPNSQIYIHSLLPVAKKRERNMCKNSTIIRFNASIKQLAEEKNISFIDIHSSYVLNGQMNPDYPREDGLHLLTESYEPWYQKIKDTLKI